MFQLQSLNVPTFLPGLRIRQKLTAALTRIPANTDFCVVKVQTTARIPDNLEERARVVRNIPVVASAHTLSALERAVAVVSEESAPFGWHFHLPLRGLGLDRTLLERIWRDETDEKLRQAVRELITIAHNEVDPLLEAHMHDIGARGRRVTYLGQIRQPEAYALGVLIH